MNSFHNYYTRQSIITVTAIVENINTIVIILANYSNYKTIIIYPPPQPLTLGLSAAGL